MVTFEVTFSDEECRAIAPMLRSVRDAYAERMSVSELHPRDTVTEAYVAWMRLAAPVFRRLQEVRKQRGKA